MVEAVSFWSFSSNYSLLYFFLLFKGGEAGGRSERGVKESLDLEGEMVLN